MRALPFSAPVRIGVIGTGQIGRSHLKAYAEIPEAHVVAVADPRDDARAAIQSEFGIPAGYADYREVLARDDIDAVDICVHNNKHAPLTIAALAAGKHVYCEKPMAATWRDAADMVAAAARHDRRLHIQLAQLYSAETRAARRLIREGRLGRVYHARSYGHRRRGRPYVDGYGAPAFVDRAISGGGALCDMGIYHLTQILHLLDNPAVLTVSGLTHQEIPMDESRRTFSRYSVEEFAVGLARLAGGISFAIEESWAVHHEGGEASKIYGSEGGLRFNPLVYYSSPADIPGNTTFDLNATDTRWRACDPLAVWHTSSARHWIGGLLGLVPPLPTAAYALNAALITEGIYLSQQLGREVTADEIRQRSASSAIDPTTPEQR